MTNNPIARRIIAAIIAVLLLIYVGYQVYLSQSTGLRTETAMYSTLAESIETVGYAIRDERLIMDHYNGILNFTLNNGDKTAKNGVIAEVYPSESDAAAKNRIDKIDNELARLSVLENPGDYTSTNPKNIGTQISGKITTMLTDIRNGDFESFSALKYDLQLLLNQKELITGQEQRLDYAQYISELESERSMLERSCSPSIGSVRSPAAGYFIQGIDGYENRVSKAEALSLTVEDLNELMDLPPSNSIENALGKISTDFTWYIACEVTERDLVLLDRITYVNVEMPFASVESIPAEIVKINRDNTTGGAVLVLKCSDMNSDFASVRIETIKINIQNYSGVLVSEKAIHYADVTETVTDADGNVTEVLHKNVQGVYIKSGSRIRFVQVFFDAAINGYAVCKTSLTQEEKAQLVTRRTIRLYDEVIVEGTNLYDGRML